MSLEYIVDLDNPAMVLDAEQSLLEDARSIVNEALFENSFAFERISTPDLEPGEIEQFLLDDTDWSKYTDEEMERFGYDQSEIKWLRYGDEE